MKRLTFKEDRSPAVNGAEPESIKRKLESRWKALCELYLPLKGSDLSWRYSRKTRKSDPEQGWKLHISATILNANKVLEKVAPFLKASHLVFKAPSSLTELSRLNCGLYYGYSQIGKFITIYPRREAEAVKVAEYLDELLKDTEAPGVPFDMQVRYGSNVYYRYGAFKRREIKQSDGRVELAILGPDRKPVPDLRDKPFPDWVKNPFKPVPAEIYNVQTKLQTYRAFLSIRQRGKGGVYYALDFSKKKPELRILKEGRKHGEVRWNGHDGYYLIKRESAVLKEMLENDIGVPRIYDSFEAGGNFYMVLEYIHGKSLEDLLKKRKRRLSVRQILKLGKQTAELISRIHSCGWVWQDCKPANLIVTPKGALRPIDFEGACRINGDGMDWKTHEFYPPRCGNSVYTARPSQMEDLYALGAVLYYLVTAEIYDHKKVKPAPLRRNFPAAAEKIINALLELPVETFRPSAEEVAEKFDDLLGSYKDSKPVSSRIALT